MPSRPVRCGGGGAAATAATAPPVYVPAWFMPCARARSCIPIPATSLFSIGCSGGCRPSRRCATIRSTRTGWPRTRWRGRRAPARKALKPDHEATPRHRGMARRRRCRTCAGRSNAAATARSANTQRRRYPARDRHGPASCSSASSPATRRPAGRPFVGPAGQLLERALAQLGIDRREVYITNAVKHFKFELRGRRRIHKTPAQEEAAACLHWLESEIELVDPAPSSRSERPRRDSSWARPLPSPGNVASGCSAPMAGASSSPCIPRPAAHGTRRQGGSLRRVAARSGQGGQQRRPVRPPAAGADEVTAWTTPRSACTP